MTEKLIMHGNTNSLGAGQDPVNFNLNSPQSESGLPAPGPHINPNQQVMKTNQYRMKKIFFSLTAALACLAGSASAAVTPIGLNGTAGPFTFDTQPGLADGWSTFLWSGGANGTADTYAIIDGRVQLLTAGSIATALGSLAGTPPTAATAPAHWASAEMRIYTRPTGTAGDVIMATLVNNSGGNITNLTLDYDLSVENNDNAVRVEEVYGHIVYYSLSGAANSWVAFSAQGGNGQQPDNTLGTFHKNFSTSLSATPVLPGGTVYVLFADDNGSGTPDNALEIDNISFTEQHSAATTQAPVFVNNTDPVDRTAATGTPTTFTAVATGNPAPTYQWYSNDVAHALSGQTSSSYTIASLKLTDAGSYFVIASNNIGTATSRHAVLTVTNGPGPISFTNSGTGVITFDVLPPHQQFSTRTWAGANSDIIDFAGLDTAAKTNDATLITGTLVTSTNAAPADPTDNNQGLWSTNGFICTRPTGVAYSGIMATLVNNSGGTLNQVGIRYQFTSLTGSDPRVEQIPGQLAYYSTSGTPGSWTQITDLYDAVNDNIDGVYQKSANVTLGSPWAAGGLLYILWVDDNGNPVSPDHIYEIDNVQFLSLTPTPPTFPPPNTDPTNRTVAQCGSTTLSAGTASGFPTPTYQWYRTNGAPKAIVGATSSSYTIPNMQSGDAGTYFVVAANGNPPNATSHVATVTFVAAPTFAAVKAVSSTNQTDILISFNLPVDSATIDPNGFDIDVHERGGGGSVGVSSAAVVNGTNVLVVAGGPMTVGVSYDVEFQNAGAGNTCTGAKVIGNVHVTASVVILLIDDQQMWRYNDSGNAPAAQGALQWTDVGWDDSAWLQGLAVFDAKRNQDRRTNTTPFIGISNTPVRTMLTLSNATADLTTYNFRTHFGNFPYGVPNRLQAVSFFDDGGAVWVNGTLGFRNRDDATNVFAAYSGNPYAINPASDAIYEGLFDLPAIALTTANNVVAVELKQADATSSDATMGLILIGLYDSFAPRLNAATDRNFQQTDLTWSSGTLQYNTNLSRGSGWHDVPGAVSPYTVFWSPGLGAGHAGGTNTLFYRLR